MFIRYTRILIIQHSRKEHMWHILQTNCGLKWLVSIPTRSKRTKINASGSYSNSPNPTPRLNATEDNNTASMVRPTGREVAKRKGKGIASQTIVKEDNDISTSIKSVSAQRDERKANIH